MTVPQVPPWPSPRHHSSFRTGQEEDLSASVPRPCLRGVGNSKRGCCLHHLTATTTPRSVSLLPRNENASSQQGTGRDARRSLPPAAEMLHCYEEVEWRGEGLKAELGRGAAAAAAPHGAGEIWASSLHPAPARAGTVFPCRSAQEKCCSLIFGHFGLMVAVLSHSLGH